MGSFLCGTCHSTDHQPRWTMEAIQYCIGHMLLPNHYRSDDRARNTNFEWTPICRECPAFPSPGPIHRLHRAFHWKFQCSGSFLLQSNHEAHMQFLQWGLSPRACCHDCIPFDQRQAMKATKRIGRKIECQSNMWIL